MSPPDLDLASAYDISEGRLFHFAMAVPDLPAAMDLLGPALNLTWTSIWPMTREMDTPDGRTSTNMQAVYSRHGPPFVELVSGDADGFFAAPDGPRLHHAGYIVEDVAAEAERLQALGMTIAGIGPGDPPGSAFAVNDAGLTLEIMGAGIRSVLQDWFDRSDTAS